jgi:hypothetical protein
MSYAGAHESNRAADQKRITKVERFSGCHWWIGRNNARMTGPISQLKRSFLSIINFSETDFPAAIGGSGETMPE